MLSLRPFFATTLLLAATHGVAKELISYDSLRLVSAMREDERLARVEKLQRAQLSKPDRECLDRLEYPELTDIAARRITGLMTSAEVQDALGYFQSSGGQKFVRRELDELGEVPFTTADQAELERFKQRPAGRKLFQDLILRNPVVTAEVSGRVDRLLQECAYLRQNEAEREIPEKSCAARPVPSSDNVCLATYVAEGAGKKLRRAGVEVNCRRDGRILTSRINLPKPETPIGLRWTNDRDLEILVDGKVKNAPAPAGSNPKVTFLSRQASDPPLLECAPQMRGRPMLINSLPAKANAGGWRTYAAPGLCLMTARVLKQSISGGDGDVLLQFRRQKSAVAPFATAELALIVEIEELSEQPLLVSFGQRRLSLIAHPPQQKHMLTGEPAEIMLEGLRSRPVELTVRGAQSYSIPTRALDFDFAYGEFRECLAALAKT
jgi:hypothetical protein